MSITDIFGSGTAINVPGAGASNAATANGVSNSLPVLSFAALLNSGQPSTNLNPAQPSTNVAGALQVQTDAGPAIVLPEFATLNISDGTQAQNDGAAPLEIGIPNISVPDLINGETLAIGDGVMGQGANSVFANQNVNGAGNTSAPNPPVQSAPVLNINAAPVALQNSVPSQNGLPLQSAQSATTPNTNAANVPAASLQNMAINPAVNNLATNNAAPVDANNNATNTATNTATPTLGTDAMLAVNNTPVLAAAQMAAQTSVTPMRPAPKNGGGAPILPNASATPQVPSSILAAVQSTNSAKPGNGPQQGANPSVNTANAANTAFAPMVSGLLGNPVESQLQTQISNQPYIDTGADRTIEQFGGQETDKQIRPNTLSTNTAAPAAQQMAHSRVGSEAVQKFAARLAARANGGATKFEMRIDPPQLGRVEVKIEISADNRVQAILHVENPDVLQDLQKNADALRRALIQEGFDLGSNDLDFQLGQQNTNSGYENPEFMNETDAEVLDHVMDVAMVDSATEIDTGHGYLLVPDQRIDIKA